MTSGKCPHPWNKTKKGTFSIGHEQINKGKGCFEKGHIISKELKNINKKIAIDNYKKKIHPFFIINKFAEEHANPEAYYGITKKEWRSVRTIMKERDNWTCQKCGIDLHFRKSNCHHIIPYVMSKNNNENNLITLCIPCHISIEQHTRMLFERLGRIGKV